MNNWYFLILVVSFLFNFFPIKIIKKYDQLFFSVLIVFTVFAITVRPLTFSDDDNYIFMLQDFKTLHVSDLGKISSLFYYLNIFIFKFVSNVKTVLKINFILIWLIIYISFIKEKVRFKVRFFFLYFMMFQVLFFIQLRNAYAIVFLSWGLLRQFNNKKGHVFFIISILFHYSVLPFILVYFLFNRKYSNEKKINLKNNILLLLVAIILAIFFYDFYNIYVVSSPIFERYFFDYISAPEIGNTSVLQFSLLFLYLALILINKDNFLETNSNRIKYAYTIYWGILIAILFFSLPLFQRIIIPFYLYSIIVSLNTNSMRFSGFFRIFLCFLILLIHLAISINRIKYFEDWIVL